MAQTYRYIPGKASRVVRHPAHGGYVAPVVGHEYASDDPLVKAFPHLFATDREIGSDIEQATRAPGEVRKTRRGRPPKA